MWAVFGNVFHDVFQSLASNIPPLKKYGEGTSWQDYVLSGVGMDIGWQITTGNVTPLELGALMEQRLRAGSGGQTQRLESIWGPLADSPSIR